MRDHTFLEFGGHALIIVLIDEPQSILIENLTMLFRHFVALVYVIVPLLGGTLRLRWCERRHQYYERSHCHE